MGAPVTVPQPPMFVQLPFNPLGTAPSFSSWTTFLLNNQAPPDTPVANGPYRPPQWNQKQLTSLLAVLPSGGGTAAGVTSGQAQTTPTTYFFDAVIRLEHSQSLRRTEHPIQSGASVVDHAYLLPARVVLEIGMSDAMDRFQSGMFTSDTSKSISAFQTLLDLQKLRVPLTLNTRLRSYNNMLIEDIRALEDNRTVHGLRALVSFSQIILANLATTTVSARPDQNGVTNEGTKNPTDLPPDVQNLLNGMTVMGDPFHK